MRSAAPMRSIAQRSPRTLFALALLLCPACSAETIRGLGLGPPTGKAGDPNEPRKYSIFPASVLRDEGDRTGGLAIGLLIHALDPLPPEQGALTDVVGEFHEERMKWHEGHGLHEHVVTSSLSEVRTFKDQGECRAVCGSMVDLSTGERPTTGILASDRGDGGEVVTCEGACVEDAWRKWAVPTADGERLKAHHNPYWLWARSVDEGPVRREKIGLARSMTDHGSESWQPLGILTDAGVLVSEFSRMLVSDMQIRVDYTYPHPPDGLPVTASAFIDLEEGELEHYDVYVIPGEVTNFSYTSDPMERQLDEGDVSQAKATLHFQADVTSDLTAAEVPEAAR